MKKKKYLILIVVIICCLLSGVAYKVLRNSQNLSFLTSAHSQMKTIHWAFVYYEQDYGSTPYVKNYNSEEIMTYLIKWYIKKTKDSFDQEIPLPALLYSGNSKNIFCNGYNLDANDLMVAKKLWEEKAKQLSVDKNEVEDLPLAWEVNPRHDGENIAVLTPFYSVKFIKRKKFYEIKNFVDAELEKLKDNKELKPNSTNPSKP